MSSGQIVIYGELLPLSEIKGKAIRYHHYFEYYFKENGEIGKRKQETNYPAYKLNENFFKFIENSIEHPCKNINDFHVSSLRIRLIKNFKSYEEMNVALRNGFVYCFNVEEKEMDFGFITKISRPKFEKEVGNKKNGTFDFIKVLISCATSVKEWKTLFKQNCKEIIAKVIEKIKEDKRFQKYGVPINFLKVDKILLCNDGDVEITFSLAL